MLIGANASSTIGSGRLVNAMPAKAKPANSNAVRRLLVCRQQPQSRPDQQPRGRS